EVFGDRSVAAPQRVTPFMQMPIVYEKAFGGMGYPNNLSGMGFGGDATALPNIVSADPARAKDVASFGPIASVWPQRKRLARGRSAPAPQKPGHDRGASGPKPRAPSESIIELADDFDWTFFQAAPEDQRLDALPPC